MWRSQYASIFLAPFAVSQFPLSTFERSLASIFRLFLGSPVDSESRSNRIRSTS